MGKRFAEDDLQTAVANYLDLLPFLWTHVANERKTSIRAGVRLKKKGVKAGVPDVLIFTKRGRYSGMAIELKVAPNKPTKSQEAWLNRLAGEGWYTCVCYNLDEVITQVKNYIDGK